MNYKIISSMQKKMYQNKPFTEEC